MGIMSWLRQKLIQSKRAETVPFYDFTSGSIVQIPRIELAANAVQVKMEGVKTLVWVLPEQLNPGDVKHAPFSEPIRDRIKKIQNAFSEHYPLSFEEWEDGFRRDTSPAKEIALWLYAADVYMQFAADERSADRRDDIYRCIITCMTASADSVWDIYRPHALEQTEARQVIQTFYKKDT